jgi:hypothetical protein
MPTKEAESEEAKHAPIPSGQLVEHLSDSLSACAISFRAGDPPDAIVPLVRRPVVVRLQQTVSHEGLAYVIGHRVTITFEA